MKLIWASPLAGYMPRFDGLGNCVVCDVPCTAMNYLVNNGKKYCTGCWVEKNNPSHPELEKIKRRLPRQLVSGSASSGIGLTVSCPMVLIPSRNRSNVDMSGNPSMTLRVLGKTWPSTTPMTNTDLQRETQGGQITAKNSLQCSWHT